MGTLRLTDHMDPIVDQIDWRIHYDLDERAFIDRRKLPKDPDPRYFPVRSLLNTADFFKTCRRIQQQVDDEQRAQRWLDEADRLSSAFRDYQLPLIHIREADLEGAVTVFARLNRTGRKMTADELVSALTYQEGQFDLANMLNGFRAELNREGFGNLDRVFLLRSVLAALERDIYAQDWADLMVKSEVRERLPEAFDAATRGIRLALKMLRRLGVTSDRLLPYGLQLVLLGEFHRIQRCPTAELVELLEALVLGDVVHRLVRPGDFGTGQARLERHPCACTGYEGGVQRSRSGCAGTTVSRPLRRSKRPGARLPAVSGLPSASFSSGRR